MITKGNFIDNRKEKSWQEKSIILASGVFLNFYSMADHKIIFTQNLGWIEEEKCTNDTLPCAYVTYIVHRSDPTYTNLAS